MEAGPKGNITARRTSSLFMAAANPVLDDFLHATPAGVMAGDRIEWARFAPRAESQPG